MHNRRTAKKVAIVFDLGLESVLNALKLTKILLLLKTSMNLSNLLLFSLLLTAGRPASLYNNVASSWLFLAVPICSMQSCRCCCCNHYHGVVVMCLITKYSQPSLLGLLLAQEEQ
jgi:hypothetical protein